jgi:dienelactone hydrolase
MWVCPLDGKMNHLMKRGLDVIRGAVMPLLSVLLLSGCGAQAGTAPSPTPRPVGITVADTAPPPGVNVPGAHWIKIRGAGGVPTNEQIAAVFRPPGQGPFPLVVELHGGLGLKDGDVEWAARLAAAGFVTVASGWQPSTVPPNTFQFYELTITFIACPRLGPGGSASGPLPGDVDAIAALIAAGRMQPGLRPDAVGLYGVSGGGIGALQEIAARRDIRATALDSPGSMGLAPEASKINTPVLVLSGTGDSFSAFTDQKNYVEALQQAGKDVEWHYYQGGRHTLILDPANKDDAIRRIIDFFTRRLTVGS